MNLWCHAPSPPIEQPFPSSNVSIAGDYASTNNHEPFSLIFIPVQETTYTLAGMVYRTPQQAEEHLI